MLLDDNVAARQSVTVWIKRLLVLGLVCLAGLAAPPFRAHASPELQLSPDEGHVGEVVTVHGTGFGPLTDVVILFSGDEIPTGPEAVTTNETGQFTAEFEIPYFTSPGTFIVEAIEDSANETSATTELTVLNTPPAADELPPVAIEENGSELIALTASDDNGDALSLEIVDEPAHGGLSEFDEDTGEILYTPDEGYNGQDSFSFRAFDGAEYSPSRIVNITISGINDKPVALDDSIEMDGESKKKITLEANDADGDPLTFSIVSDPDHGNLTGTAPTLYYEPYEGYAGSDSFRFTASDSVSESNIATVSIFVFGPDEEEYYYEDEEEEQESDYDYANSRPIALPQSLTGMEDESLPVVLAGQDADEDPLTFQIAEYPLHGEVSGSGESGKMTYTPEYEFNGTDSFTFVALDHQKASKPATISIAILAVNDPPIPVSMNLTATGGTVNFTLTATDAEGDPLQFSVYQMPSNGTLVGAAPNLFYAAEPGFAGKDKILFTVSDNRTETWIGVVFIEVGPEPLPDGIEYENEDETDSEPATEPAGNSNEPDTEIVHSNEEPVAEQQDAAKESTTKARADRSNVLVMVSWDHHEQEGEMASTLHLKFAEHRTRESLDSHIWYDLVMLDEAKNEILRKNDLVALNSEDAQEVIFPTNGTYHFEVNVKGLVDKSSNEIIRDKDYTGKALGTVVVPEFNPAAILVIVTSIMGLAVAATRHRHK